MFRRGSPTILCPSCGKITRADAQTCFFCGRRRPGNLRICDRLRTLLAHGATGPIIAACIVLYVTSLVLDPAAALRPRGPVDFFAPNPRVLAALGMTGAFAWTQGQWWTLLTAIYLHGSVLHILFNLLWIRQLGPAVEELFGPARLLVIFTVSGAAGFALSDLAGIPLTIGASGAIFGLLGAIIAFGRRRGGAFGRAILREYGQWALILFVLGFFMAGVNNVAHLGGFIGGLLSGLILSTADHRRETVLGLTLAWTLVALTLAGFVLSLWTAIAH